MSVAPLAAEASPWLALLGRSHPLLLHLPIGILPAVALLEFGALALRRPSPRGAIVALAWLGGLTAALAATSGYVLAGSGEYGETDGTLTQHKVLGIVFASLALLAALFAGAQNRRPLRILLLASLGVLVPAGHLGATITHGPDFLWRPFPEPAAGPKPVAPSPPSDTAPISPPAGSPPAGHAETPSDASPAPTPAIGPTYAADIAPWLDRTCSKCHNPTKHKGDLVLTTVEGIRKGGKGGAVLVPGKPADSPLLQNCLLPLDDDDHMPPSDRPQPTAAELELLRAWIAAGAAM